MCTVTWLHDSDGGYDLLCNRDEKRSRAIARPPRVASLDGVRFIAPIDPAGAGTWIAVNEFGLALSLLNAPGPPKPQSRGAVVLDLISARSAEGAVDRLRTIDLSRTSPFTLAILAPAEKARAANWDGDRLAFPEKSRAPLTSSSFDHDGVVASRQAEFERRFRSAIPDADALYAFHESHGHSPTAYSTCMHRADAETVSFSWVTVDGEAIDFFYAPGAPCQRNPGETLRLDRRR